MKTQEELNRLKIANTIINRGSKRLGIRPLIIGEINTKNPNTKNNSVFDNGLALNKIAKKLKEELPNNEKNKSITGRLIFVILGLLIYLFVFVFNPSEPRSIKLASPQEKINFNAPIVNNTKRIFIITTGTFKDLKKARKRLQELDKDLDVDLELVAINNNFYTIQIGPSYNNPDDALLVFDELSYYQIPQLSLRAQ